MDAYSISANRPWRKGISISVLPSSTWPTNHCSFFCYVRRHAHPHSMQGTNLRDLEDMESMISLTERGLNPCGHSISVTSSEKRFKVMALWKSHTRTGSVPWYVMFAHPQYCVYSQKIRIVCDCQCNIGYLPPR